ncbi:MAG: MFS transporter [Candidatus Bathycorpusculaceae bacterium]
MDPPTVKKPKTQWHFAIIPANMAVGSSGVLSTLLALHLGATVTEIGLLTAANATASIIFSTIWGKLSDSSGTRKNYLIIILFALIPIFLILSLVNSVSQLILYYSLLAIFTSGISPIAIMFAVESCRSKNWEREVARYNSISSVGNIFGLITNSFVAIFLEVKWLFYISSIFCLIAALMLWRCAEEPEITLERHAFPIRSLRDAEKFLFSVFHLLDIRQFRIPKSKKFKLKPLQLLFLACFVQWTGIYFFSVGETPLMKALGMPDSSILALNASASFVSIFAFSKIIPSLKQSRRELISTAIIWRSIFILGWAGVSLMLAYAIPYASVFPFLLGTIWPVTFAMIWLPIVTHAISSSPPNGKSAAQGALLSTTAIANAIGSALGGFVISTFGYTIGFISAAIITLLSAPIFSRSLTDIA